MKAIFTLIILFLPFLGFGQQTFIPDDNFEQALIDWGLDDVLDNYVNTESISDFDVSPNSPPSAGINLSGKNIEDLTGIEDFTSMDKLDISNNNLTSINLSQNINLIHINCEYNQLVDVDFSQNINLTKIRCGYNQLNNINLENIHELDILNLRDNKLKHLDLSETSFSNGGLNLLDLSSNFYLDSLDLRNQLINSLLLGKTSLKCVLVDDISELSSLSIFDTMGSIYITFNETSCAFINSNPQYAGYSLDTLSANNIESVFGQRSFCWDLNNAHFEVPKNSDKHSMISHGHWIGGIAETGDLHIAAQTYRQTGSDFFPGPVSESIYQNNELMASWDRQWKLTKNEIDFHIQNYTNDNYIANEAIMSWPAHGNIALGQSYNLAPYVDVNDNNIYEPTNGDYPCIKGDEAIFLIRNDVGNFHTESGHYILRKKYSTNLLPYIGSEYNDQYFIGTDTTELENEILIYYLYEGEGFNFKTEQFFIGYDTLYFENKLGLEQHLMFYAYNDSTNEALHHSIFVENTLYNRQNNNFDSLMIGIWNDSDLGTYLDDYVGCNVELNMGYCFNGDDNDEGASGYGNTPPAIGIKHLDHEMTSFVYYNNDLTVVGNPENGQHIYNYLTGKWKDGLDITYGEDGRGGSTPTNFMYPGSSDPTGIGTNGLITSDDWTSPEGWTEEVAGNSPYDRRFIQSAGPFEFHSGNEITMNYAFVWSKASDVGNFASLEKLFIDAQTIQDYFDLNYISCSENEDIGQLGTFNCEVDGCQDPQNGTGIYSSIEECEANCNASSIIENYLNINIFPNPSSNIFNIEFNIDAETEILVTNVLGEQVHFESIKSIGEYNTRIDLSDYSKGIYNLTIKTSEGLTNHMLILH